MAIQNANPKTVSNPAEATANTHCATPDTQPAFLTNYLLHRRIRQCLLRYAQSAILNVLG
jgi:hypothetical protein